MEWYVDVNGRKLRRGITTGTTATAALKASILCGKFGCVPRSVTVELPIGWIVDVPIEDCSVIDGLCFCSARKDAGDDADITNGVLILVAFEEKSVGDVVFRSDGGVGIVTVKGLKLEVGEPAVNPVPRAMMKKVLKEFGIREGVVHVKVENGEEIAKRTFNSRLGIKDGISILGTSGIVEPMSEEAWKESLPPEMDVIKAKGHDWIAFVPGGIGEKLHKRYFGDSENIVLCGNYFGFCVKEALKRGFRGIHISGSFQKLMKLAGGNFNTDSRFSDSKPEILITHVALVAGRCDRKLAVKIMEISPFNRVIDFLEEEGIDVEDVFSSIGDVAVRRLRQFGSAIFRVSMFNGERLLSDRMGGE